jgi:hypothetical protein
MRFRIVLCMALGLILPLGHPARSFGQQGQGNQSAPKGQPAGETVVEAVFGYSGQGNQSAPKGQQDQGQGQQANPGAQKQGANQGQGQQVNPGAQKQGQGQQSQGPNDQNGSSQQSLGAWIKDATAGPRAGRQYQYTLSPNAFAFVEIGSRNSGMRLAVADDALRAQLKLPKEEGLIVTAMEPGSPAASAGIEPNDVLLRLGSNAPKGIALGKPEDLEKGLKLVGDAPQLLILLRGGRRLAIKVQPEVKVSLGPVRPEPPSYWIGVSVGSIEPALRAQLQLPERYGLLALGVVKDSPAEKAGVKPHDILLRLDGEGLTNQTQLIQIVQAKGEKPISLELVREGKKETIEITPQRRENRTTWRWEMPKASTWEMINVGSLLPGQATGANNGSGVVYFDHDNDGDLDLLTVSNRGSNRQATEGSDGATAKRLDDLTAQVKELRQAIDALLNKAAQDNNPRPGSNANNPRQPQNSSQSGSKANNPQQSQDSNDSQSGSKANNPQQSQSSNSAQQGPTSNNAPQGPR